MSSILRDPLAGRLSRKLKPAKEVNTDLLATTNIVVPARPTTQLDNEVTQQVMSLPITMISANTLLKATRVILPQNTTSGRLRMPRTTTKNKGSTRGHMTMPNHEVKHPIRPTHPRQGSTSHERRLVWRIQILSQLILCQYDQVYYRKPSLTQQ